MEKQDRERQDIAASDVGELSEDFFNPVAGLTETEDAPPVLGINVAETVKTRDKMGG